MPRFVELWIYLSATPLFGLTATLVVYLIAAAVYARLGTAPNGKREQCREVVV